MEFKAPKLSLKKETITKLNDDQMKKVIGGIEESMLSTNSSCDNNSCNSQANTGSCSNSSCNCTLTEE